MSGMGSQRSGALSGGALPSGRTSTRQNGRMTSFGFGLVEITTWLLAVCSTVPAG